MSGQALIHRLRSLVTRIFPSTTSGEIQALKEEIQALRARLEAIDPERLAAMKEELDLVRNEMLENIAAIHRLEILTLRRRVELLNDFGKSLQQTLPARSRKSFKPEGYSFGIITNGKRPEKLHRLIGTIRGQELNQDRYEILIAGTIDWLADYDWIPKFPMEQEASEGRLGAMRNVLANGARFNKFVCLDDDFLLHSGWVEAVDEVQDDFDVATGIILNPDLSRYCDWVNIIAGYTFLRGYHEKFDTCQYVTGGYGIYKDYLFSEHCWDDELGFYQGEDVSFSRRLFDAGYQLKFIPKAVVMHDDERYTQKGYGVIRVKSADRPVEGASIDLKLEKLCPRTLS